jgi:nucleotide-binding universal stress UspA family protein
VSARSIIAGVDGSDRGRDALALARILAELRGARLIAASVYRRDDDRAAAESALAEAAGAERNGIELRTAAASSPARGLHELAEATGAEFVVVGSTHRAGIGRVLPGATGDRLLQEAPCAVAVAPLGFADRTDGAVRVVAAGYDLSPESEAAVDLAADLARAAEGTIRLLTVDEPRAARSADLIAGAYAARPYEDARERLHATVTERRDGLPAVLRADATIVSGFPAHELLEELDKGVDIVVLGSRGYGPLGRALVGSVSADVIQASPCPVVLVPRAAAREARAATETTRENEGATA